MGKHVPSDNTGNEENTKYELHESSSEERASSEHETDPHTKRMEELENHLEAIAHHGDLQKDGGG